MRLQLVVMRGLPQQAFDIFASEKSNTTSVLHNSCDDQEQQRQRRRQQPLTCIGAQRDAQQGVEVSAILLPSLHPGVVPVLGHILRLRWQVLGERLMGALSSQQHQRARGRPTQQNGSMQRAALQGGPTPRSSRRCCSNTPSMHNHRPCTWNLPAG